MTKLFPKQTLSWFVSAGIYLFAGTPAPPQAGESLWLYFLSIRLSCVSAHSRPTVSHNDPATEHACNQVLEMPNPSLDWQELR